jgi:hypothetical protein
MAEATNMVGDQTGGRKKRKTSRSPQARGHVGKLSAEWLTHAGTSFLREASNRHLKNKLTKLPVEGTFHQELLQGKCDFSPFRYGSLIVGNGTTQAIIVFCK